MNWVLKWIVLPERVEDKLCVIPVIKISFHIVSGIKHVPKVILLPMKICVLVLCERSYIADLWYNLWKDTSVDFHYNWIYMWHLTHGENPTDLTIFSIRDC